MCAAVNIHPIDPLRGPIVEAVADSTTWSSPEWSNLTHRGVSILVSSTRAVTLLVDHASSSETLTSAPLSSQHAVGSGVPVAVHRRLDGRVSRVRISNASGASAIVTVDVLLRPTAEDHASMRLTLAGEEVADDNPFPTVGAVVGDVDVVQAVASSLNATVTQAGTVTVDGLEMQAAVVESPNNTAVYPIAAPCRVYGIYFSHDNGALLQSLALYDSTAGVTSASTPKISLMLPSGKTHDDFGTGNYLAFSSGVAVRCVAAISPSSTTSPSANTQAVIIYRLV